MEQTNYSFDKLFTWMQLPLKFIGLNVLDPNWKFSPLTLFSIAYLALQQYCTHEFIFTHLHTLDILTECVAINATGYNVAFRLFRLIFNRQKLINSIGIVLNQRNDGFRQLNEEFRRGAFLTMRVVVTMYMLTMTLQLIPLFFSDPRKNNLPLAMFLPFIPPDVAPYWHINYAYQSVLNLMAILFLTGVDNCMAISVLTAVYQIRKLKKSLLELDAGADSKVLHRELAAIVERHVALREFVVHLESMYAAELLVLFGVICLSLCMCLNVVATDIWTPVALFLLSVCFDLFMICYYGNLLIIESDTLADCVYGIDWVSMPVSAQRLVVIMIANAQPALELNGIFMPLSMASCMSILKASYSYYTLLR